MIITWLHIIIHDLTWLLSMIIIDDYYSWLLYIIVHEYCTWLLYIIEHDYSWLFMILQATQSRGKKKKWRRLGRADDVPQAIRCQHQEANVLVRRSSHTNQPGKSLNGLFLWDFYGTSWDFHGISMGLDGIYPPLNLYSLRSGKPPSGRGKLTLNGPSSQVQCIPVITEFYDIWITPKCRDVMGCHHGIIFQIFIQTYNFHSFTSNIIYHTCTSLGSMMWSSKSSIPRLGHGLGMKTITVHHVSHRHGDTFDQPFLAFVDMSGVQGLNTWGFP